MANLEESTAASNAPPRLFGTNGIRGVVGPEINVDFAYRVGSAMATVFKGQKVLVGRDGRTSGRMLLEAVVSGILAQGNDVEDNDMITTPALQFLVKTSTSGVGIMVTASHNPPEYNGFKLIDTDGIEVPRRKEEVIERLVHRNEWTLSHQPGSRTPKDRLDNYLVQIQSHLEAVNPKFFQERTVVVDIGNGVSAFTTPIMLQRLGCRVVTINGNVDGSFPGRMSEPRPENLMALSQAVIYEKADLGIAHDGDGDRAIFVDEKGTIHWGDSSLAVVEDMVLQENPGAKLVTPLNSSMAVREIAEKRHGRLILTKVGSIYVSRTMIRENAVLGGEENGGIFYMPHHPVRDGTMATALILKAMAKKDESLASIVSRLPLYQMAKEKIVFKSVPQRDRAMGWLAQKLRNRKPDTMDGLKIEIEGRGWILIRPSGTEPLIRIYAEGRTETDVNRIIGEFKPLVEESAKA